MAQDVGRWREYVHQSWRNADWTRLRLNLVRPSASVSMRPSVAPARQQTVSEHQQRIGEYRRLRTFDAATGERLARFLEDAARRLERTASLLARARAWLRDEHVLAPADSVLRRAVGAARHNARALLTDRMAERLSASMRSRLDALVAVDDDQPHSPCTASRPVTRPHKHEQIVNVLLEGPSSNRCDLARASLGQLADLDGRPRRRWQQYTRSAGKKGCFGSLPYRSRGGDGVPGAPDPPTR